MCFGKEYLMCSLIEYLVYFCAGDICILGVQESVSGLFWLQYSEVCWLSAFCHMMFCYSPVKFQYVKKSTISSSIVVTRTLRAR